MLIVYDHNIFSWQSYGGISRYVTEIATRVNQVENCSAKVLAPLFVNSFLKNLPTSERIGLPVPKIPKTGKIKYLINDLLSILWLKKNKPDIFHETYCAPRKLAPNNSVVVLTVYDMNHEMLPEYFPVQDRAPLYKARAVKRANHIICISNNTKKNLMNIHNVPEDKISVIYLGYEFNSKITLRTWRNLIGVPYILFVGPRYSYKNFWRLVTAFAKSKLLSDFKLVCFGGSALTNCEMKKIRSANLSTDRVIHLQGSDIILASLYQHATVFVYPSLCEGFGIPPLEAMSCSCPVICSNAGPLPEVAGKAAYYFDPYNEQDLQLAIEKVVFSNTLQNKLVTEGLEQIQQYSWEKCATQTLTLYKSLVEC